MKITLSQVSQLSVVVMVSFTEGDENDQLWHVGLEIGSFW